MRKPQREIIKSIMRDPAPELGDRWSPLFQRFVNKCLMKNIRSRPSARELLEDEFLVGAADYAEDFGNLVIQQLEIKENGFSVRQVDEEVAPTFERLMEVSVDYKDPIDSNRASESLYESGYFQLSLE